MAFLETIVVYDIKVGRWSQLNEYMNLYEYHSLTLVQCHSDLTFSNFFSSKSTRSFKAKFHMKPPWDVGMKICSRWLPGSYMVKTFKHLLLRNQETDDLETWCTASGTEVLPN